jgi:hypothetical protein
MSQSVDDRISGSIFEAYENGTAEFIEAYVSANTTNESAVSTYMIHRVNDSILIGTTEEVDTMTFDGYNWYRFNFSEPKPQLTANTMYSLSCWSNDETMVICFYNTTENFSMY